MKVLDAEVWQLLDERLEAVRRLPHDELMRLAAGAPEMEVLERPSGAFRRRTQVVTLPNDRLGIRVRVDVEGARRPAEGGIVITYSGDLAPEWSRREDPPRSNPFAFGARATLAGVALCVVLLVLFFLLT
jgi:hypothetical protein